MRHLVQLLGALALVLACAGVPTADGPGGGAGGGSVNGPLQGQVVLGSDGWVLDLGSGAFRRIPGLEAWDDNPQYLGVARVAAVPRPDGAEVLETVHSCMQREGSHVTLSCVNSVRGGRVEPLLTLRGRLLGAARLSPDGRHIGWIRQYGSSASDMDLEILTREGKLVSSSTIFHRSQPVSFDWLPDGRIVYALENAIHVAGPDLATHRVVRTFEDGAPVGVRVSPRGDRVLFLRVSSSNFAATRATVWTMAPDGSGLARVVASKGEKDPVITHLAWSPDAAWILLESGTVRGADSTNPGVAGKLFAVRASDRDVVLGTDGRSRVIRSRGAMRRGREGELGERFVSDGYLAWVPRL